jgi:putative thioredoxin
METMPNDTFDFQSDVIELSNRKPVLVDFWAAWCGPCRLLAPVLEKLAEKNTDAWTLVKIDTEEFPDIAARYGVRGIPNVKLFSKGTVIDEFSGALPEYQIEQWLRKALPSPHAEEIDRAEAEAAAGDAAGAVSRLERVLQEESDSIRAKGLLIRLILCGRPEESLRLSESIEGEPEYRDLCESVRTIAALLLRPPALFSDDTVRDDYIRAVTLLRQEDFDGALDAFIGVLRKNRYYDDDGSRKVCIAIFRLLGEEHAVTSKHRRAFDRAF